jgi:hypothetical protein
MPSLAFHDDSAVLEQRLKPVFDIQKTSPCKPHPQFFPQFSADVPYQERFQSLQDETLALWEVAFVTGRTRYHLSRL